MKYQLNRLAVTIGLSAVMGSALLIAGAKQTAEIPFDFQVRGHVLPAGTYAVQQMSNPTAMVIRNVDTGESMVTLTPLEKRGKGGDARLVFNRYGDRYFLSQIWFASEDAGHGLLPSSAEKEIAPSGAGVLASIRLK